MLYIINMNKELGSLNSEPETRPIKPWKESASILDIPQGVAAEIAFTTRLLKTFAADAQARLPYLQRRASDSLNTDREVLTYHVTGLMDAYSAHLAGVESEKLFIAQRGEEGYFYQGIINSHTPELETYRNEVFAQASKFTPKDAKRINRDAYLYLIHNPLEQSVLLKEKTGYVYTPPTKLAAEFVTSGVLQVASSNLESLAAAGGGAVAIGLEPLKHLDSNVAWVLALLAYGLWWREVKLDADQAWKALETTGICSSAIAKAGFEYGRAKENPKLQRFLTYGGFVLPRLLEEIPWITASLLVNKGLEAIDLDPINNPFQTFVVGASAGAAVVTFLEKNFHRNLSKRKK